MISRTLRTTPASPPARGRELKHKQREWRLERMASPPAQGRELKLEEVDALSAVSYEE